MEKFNPIDWQFIVQSKTGKMYPFQTLEEAEEAAKRKSTRSTYSVYHNGKFVSAFAKNKRTPNWQTIYYVVNEDYLADYEKYFKHAIYRLIIPKTIYSHNYDYAIDICDEKIRIKCRSWCVDAMPNGKKHCYYKPETLTLYNNGRAIHTYGNTINSSIRMPVGSKKIANDMKEILYKEMLSRRPELKQVLENCRDFDELIAGYTHPNSKFITDDYKKLIRRRNDDSISVCWYPNTLTNEADLIPAICKRLRIPCTKTLKKLFIANKENIIIAKGLVDMGIRDVNNILKLSSVSKAYWLANKNEKDTICKITKKFVKCRSENWLASRLVQEGLRGIADSVRMIHHGKIDERIVDFVIKECRNMAEFHNTIMSNYQAPERKTRTIKYTKEETKRFNHKYGDIQFKLATDNKDLAIIGAEMGICVGSYASVALNHATTIVKMTSKENYIACIEVRDNCLIQLKAHFNNPVKIEYKDIIDQWLSEAEINYEECYDYQAIGEKWRGNHNYAFVDPGMFEHRMRTPKPLEIVKSNPYRDVATDCWKRTEQNRVNNNFSSCLSEDPVECPF